MIIRPYTDADAARWNDFLRAACNGLFQHHRDYLAYHGKRFRDLSVLLENEKGQVVAIFPAAQEPSHPCTVVSHPGITYGGLVHSAKFRGEDIIGFLPKLARWYAELGYSTLTYKAVPVHLTRLPAQAEQYALWRAGARLMRKDLWNVIQLDGARRLSKGCKWALGKARKNGITIQPNVGRAAYPSFHELLSRCLEERHGVEPVHTLDDLLRLQSTFPHDIGLWLARGSRGELLSGVWLFRYGKRAWHTQYIASSPEGRDSCSINLLIEEIIGAAEAEGVAYLSFGASTYAQGHEFNQSLFDFKASFGFGAVTQDFYQLDLRSDREPH